MSIKESATIDVGYPIYGVKFINNKTIVAAGGGGEGKHGIPNKITVIKSSFKVTDSKRRLQRFREITLPSNEDSPQCLDTAKLVGENEFNVIIGCNQSSELLKSMNINNNIRKYTYSAEEHLGFVDAAQFEEDISGTSEDYPKVIRLSHDNNTGALMTSRVPSSIYIFNPDSLQSKYKFTPKIESEIKDFALSSYNGASLAYVTSSSIEIIETNTGNSTFSSLAVAALDKQLKGYILSKLKFIEEDKSLLIAAGARGSAKGAVLFKFNIASKKITQIQTVSKKFNNIVALDVTSNQDLVAIAGNDLSVTLIRLSTLQVIKVFNKLHPFAITCLSFSPNGLKLASGSASNTLHVFKIPANYGHGKSVIGTLFQYLFTIILVVALGVGVQKLNETGQLAEILENSKEYTDVAQEYAKLGYEYAQHYGTIGYSIVEEYAKTYGNQGLQFIKEKLNKEEADTEASTLNDIVREVTKDIDEEITKSDFDSEEFFQDRDNYITTSIGHHYEETPKVETTTASSEETFAEQSIEEVIEDEPLEVNSNNDTSIEEQPTVVDRESVLPESLRAMLDKETTRDEPVAEASEVVEEPVIERAEPVGEPEVVVEQDPVQEEEPGTVPVVDEEPVTIPVVDEEPATIPVVDEEPVTIPVVEEEQVTIPVVGEPIIEKEEVVEVAEVAEEAPVSEETEQPIEHAPKIHVDVDEPESSSVDSDTTEEETQVEEVLEEVVEEEVIEEEVPSQEPVESSVIEEVVQKVMEEEVVSEEPESEEVTTEEPETEEPQQEEVVIEEPNSGEDSSPESQPEEVPVQEPEQEVVEEVVEKVVEEVVEKVVEEVVEEVIEEEIVEEVEEPEPQSESEPEQPIVMVHSPSSSSSESPEPSQVVEEQIPEEVVEEVVEAEPIAEPKPEDVIEEKESEVTSAVPEPSPEVEEPQVQEPVVEESQEVVVEEPVQEPVHEPVHEQVQEQVQEPVQEPIQEPVQQPIEKSVVEKPPAVEQVPPPSSEQPQQQSTTAAVLQKETKPSQESSASKKIRTKKITRTIKRSKPTHNPAEKDEL